MGVRTFLPSTSLARSEPAIIRLTRFLDYSAVDVCPNGMLHFLYETMQMNAPAPEIDLWESAFLEEIEEMDGQGLRLVVAEAKASPVAKQIKIGGVDLGEGYPVRETGRKVEITWAGYVAYGVRNESYCTLTPEEEIAAGKKFRVYAKSYFLNYISRATLATSEYPGPFLHYALLTENHVVDVASTSVPVVRVL